MNRSILYAFIADQRQAKSLVAQRLHVPENIPALDWVVRYREIRDAYDASPFADVFRPHGYGLEIKIGELYIDYDYSATGRADGFDVWRIFVYITAGQFDNNGPDDLLWRRVEHWFEEMKRSGHIMRIDNLYYINREPSSPV